LDDVDLVASGVDELFAELAREPARLELELTWNPKRKEKRALANACRAEHLRIAQTVPGVGHVEQPTQL
jgi:hypothetical protein